MVQLVGTQFVVLMHQLEDFNLQNKRHGNDMVARQQSLLIVAAVAFQFAVLRNNIEFRVSSNFLHNKRRTITFFVYCNVI